MCFPVLNSQHYMFVYVAYSRNLENFASHSAYHFVYTLLFCQGNNTYLTLDLNTVWPSELICESYDRPVLKSMKRCSLKCQLYIPPAPPLNALIHRLIDCHYQHTQRNLITLWMVMMFSFFLVRSIESQAMLLFWGMESHNTPLCL